jgi:hypothetical protein
VVAIARINLKSGFRLNMVRRSVARMTCSTPIASKGHAPQNEVQASFVSTGPPLTIAPCRHFGDLLARKERPVYAAKLFCHVCKQVFTAQSYAKRVTD